MEKEREQRVIMFDGFGENYGRESTLSNWDGYLNRYLVDKAGNKYLVATYFSDVPQPGDLLILEQCGLSTVGKEGWWRIKNRPNPLNAGKFDVVRCGVKDRIVESVCGKRMPNDKHRKGTAQYRLETVLMRTNTDLAFVAIVDAGVYGEGDYVPAEACVW